MPTQNSILTNIITGFLGVGKTTAITHLLRHKPEIEIWSILVNEFGEVGIDGAMLKSINAHVREVPGGCICCVAGLPMKIALNMLIANTKPDRILIEPTGLGHPEEIINTLIGEYYDSVLDLRATLTLVDPRKLTDSRYINNANFQDQLAVADILVANKIDLCSLQDKNNFQQLVKSFEPKKHSAHWVEQGELLVEWLDAPRLARVVKNPAYHRNNALNPRREILPTGVRLPTGKDFVRQENKGQGFYSCGWLFKPEWQFNFNLLFLLISGFTFTRTKAVMKTQQGVYIFNSEAGVLSVNQLQQELEKDISDSRIELIDDKPIDTNNVEQQLLSVKASA